MRVHFVVVVAGTVVVVARVVVVVDATVVVGFVVVVVGFTLVVVAPATVGVVAAVGVPLAGETRNVTSIGLETTSRLAWLGGISSGAFPASTNATRVTSTSLPKSGALFVHTAVTALEPSSCTAGLTIWKRLARLAVGPPRAELVVLRPTTSPGNEGLAPTLAVGAGAGRAPPKRKSAGSAAGSRAVKVRATTSPRPPLPCTEPRSGDSRRARTGVVGRAEVVVVSKIGSVVRGDAPSLSDEQDTRSAAARPAVTNRRSIPGPYRRDRRGGPAWYVAAMPETKRDRQKAQRQARLAREAAAAKAAAQRRRMIRFAVITLAVIGLVAFITTRGDDSTDVETAGSSTTVPGGSSAAGKPCVPVADPLPASAPAVPVKLGPPPTQLLKEDLKEGTGATVGAKDTVTVNYIGVACSTGKIFDSSYSRGQPATFALSGVIKGWTDGIPGMKVGGQRLLGIPPDQGYGAQGSPPDIGANETLWFVVEIVDTKAG